MNEDGGEVTAYCLRRGPLNLRTRGREKRSGVKKEGGQAGESVPDLGSVCYDPEAGRSCVFSGS